MFHNNESSPCPLCQREAPLFFRTKDRNRRLSEEIFSYYRCPSCRLIFLSPIPSDLSIYYPSDYYSVPSSLNELSRFAAPQKYKIELVQKFVKGGRLLEIGPSYGDFAWHAKQAGFDVNTIEMDEQCCQFLREFVRVGAIHSDDTVNALSTMATDVSYDVIALWHAIEHLPDFWKTVEAATNRLADGGILVLASPNPNSLQFRLLKGYWAHVDAPRHLALIPIRLLKRQARKLGLEPILVTTSDLGTFAQNSFGWRHSLMNLYLSDPGRIRGALLRLGTAINYLGRGIERKGLRGSTYTVIFRKGPKRVFDN